MPGLAESWTISEDGRVYTFILRQGVLFHDGTLFNAQAVSVNLERILNPQTASQRAIFLLGPIDQIVVESEYQLSIVLSAPFAPLLDGLSQPYLGIASPAALEKYDNITYQFHQVGTGPYRFIEYLPGDDLILERNPAYNWGPEIVVNPRVPAVERIVFRFLDDPSERARALESGEAEIASELLPGEAQALAERGPITISPVAVPGQPTQFMFNLRQPPTNSLAVRQALIYATDRPSLIQDVYLGLSPIAYGPLSSATFGYDPQVEGLYAFDPAEARALLDEAQLIDSDGDSWRDFDGQPVILQVIVPPWGLIPQVAGLLETQWESTLQLQVEVRQVAEFIMLRDAAAESEFNLIAFNVAGFDPIILNGFYTSGGINNWMSVSDQDLDGWLFESAIATDSARRVELYSRAQQRIMEQAFIVPIREYVSLNGSHISVDGLHYDAQGWFPYLTDLTVAGALP